ncbi:MAG: molybdopterin-dependent oxidoreductase [Desulfatiglans sp.]|nr:molybdopterin-dependent oxidoreductase [Desulfatiglans sp.]
MDKYDIIGKSVPRNHTRDKATGAAQYTDDIMLPGMLHGRLLRSPYAHARILNIDTSRAEALPGVKCVITGKDLPDVKFGNWRLFTETQDETALAIDRVRFIGDEVAAVAAIDKDIAEEALSLIRVEYEELPASFDIDTSMAKGAPVIHDPFKNNISVVRKVANGDLDKAFSECDYIREDVFNVHAISACYLEPCSSLAKCDPDGKITLWTSTQTPYMVQCLLASALGMRENDIRVIKPHVGGGFGAKMELRKWDVCAAFMAKKTGKPVKFTLTREEELATGRRRHPMRLFSKVGCKKDGTLVAKDLRILLDGGAYNAMGPTATFLCGNFGLMLYKYKSYRFLGQHVYTNNPPSSAIRGFGSPQSYFATETQMNLIADDLGIDPIEIRRMNAVKTGDVIPELSTIGSCAFSECLDKVIEVSGYHEKRKNPKKGRGIGIGCYSFISGGVFNWFNTQYPFSAAELRAFDDGTVHLLTMAADIGQGSDTILPQILAEELGLKMEDIRITSADTATTPQADLGSWGSRVTLMAGNAVIDAAKKMKEILFGAVTAHFNLNVIHELECKDGRIFSQVRPDKGLTFGKAVALAQKFNRGVPLVTRGAYTPRGMGMVTPAFSFGAQVAEVEVDEKTGKVEVKKMWTAHDCGTVLNPVSVEGQLEGSIHMGLGYVLSEQFAMEKGKTLNTTFLDYKMPSALDMPVSESICIETYEPEGPYGAKEAGEGLVGPTAPAIADAVYNAVGYRCMDMPITPEKVLKGKKDSLN